MTDFPPQLPHGDLVEVLPDVFFVTGQMVLEFDDTRRQFSRNMVVVRDGHDLTLVNTLRVDDAGLAHLDSLGTVKNIVRIGGFHGRDDAFYIDRYNAAFWAPNGIKFGRGEVPDGTLANDQPGPVTDSSVFLFETANRPEAILHLTRSGGILITCDSLQNWAEYHRAECLTHVGDSQAVRSLTQCGEPMRFAMAAPIDLRNDFDSVSLRRLAKRTRDATQSRRLLALAEVYDGGSRTDASRIGGVGLQIIRDWVLRFNARGPDGLVDGKSPGAPSKLNADHRRALAEVVEAGPVPAVDGVVRWRRKDLARWLLETFAISLDETTVGRELKALGFAKISARPRHYAQNELAVEAFKKNFSAELARLPKGVEIELWWQDEARIGQKNKLTRRWARRGTRPRAPRDQRTEWAYIFGAICPAKGKGAGLVMPWCDTDAMAAHLIEISAAVDPGAHAVLIVDQAGWHLTPKLAIPDNITVLALPPRSPELNPVENVWQFMRDNWLSNRIFKSYEDIVALCCQAWNNLIDQPWKIMSLGMRKWAHGF